jgi:hypothetical protein
MRQLVESWIAAERDFYGNDLGKAITVLNETMGGRVTRSRVSEWRRGKCAPGNAVISQLLWRTYPWVLRKAGIAVDQAGLERIEELLWYFDPEGSRYYL